MGTLAVKLYCVCSSAQVSGIKGLFFSRLSLLISLYLQNGVEGGGAAWAGKGNVGT